MRLIKYTDSFKDVISKLQIETDIRKFVDWIYYIYIQKDNKYFKRYSEEKNKFYLSIMDWLFYRIIHNDFRDYLGEIYMAIGYPTRNRGQFFTPYNIALMMAKMNFSVEFKSNDVIKVLDPACGSGTMLCAVLDVNKNNYEILRKLDLYGIDIDEYCVKMTKINLSMRYSYLVIKFYWDKKPIRDLTKSSERIKDTNIMDKETAVKNNVVTSDIIDESIKRRDILGQQYFKFSKEKDYE